MSKGSGRGVPTPGIRGRVDRTDPDVVLPAEATNPKAASGAPASASDPVVVAATTAVVIPVQSAPEDAVSASDMTMRLASTFVPRPTLPSAPLVRSEPGPAGPGELERPKVWVATHKAPPDPDPRLILVREPDSARAASFRVMRHRLADRGDPRVIAVSSASARDGKTTCAANLALALSEFGRAKVLLLEANFRAPQIAVLFGFLPPECFSVQLQRHRERPLDPWSVVEAFSRALHVLAVKPGETNRPLLDAPAFAIAIEMLRRVGYDYIIIDTPPVLGSADVNLIEDYVDAVVLAARSGRTFGQQLRAAVDQLSPRKLFGVCLVDA